jgi:hypothetical protein
MAVLAINTNQDRTQHLTLQIRGKFSSTTKERHEGLGAAVLFQSKATYPFLLSEIQNTPDNKC